MGDMADMAREQEEEAYWRKIERDARMEAADKAALAEARPLIEHAAYPGLMVKDGAVAVVGIPYPNPDGSSRMEVCKSLLVGQLLKMVREPGNKFGKNLAGPDDPWNGDAVAVHRAGVLSWPDDIHHTVSDQVGYLPAGLAAYYAPLMDDGMPLFGVLVEKRYKATAPDRMTHLMVQIGTIEEGGEANGSLASGVVQPA